MDSSEFNKVAGAGLAALLVFLLLNFFSGEIYGTREAGEHHGEEVLAFALAVEAEGAGETAGEAQVDLATLVAAADPGAGEGVFRACAACHKVEAGANGVGPSLWDVVGSDIAAVDGFQYSDALAAHEGDWTTENMFHFLENPKAWAPGTKMSFAGLKDPQDRVDVIAYLNQAGDAPVDLAAGLEPAATVADAGADAGADVGTAIPDPALSPGVGPGPGVNPPVAAAGGSEEGAGAGMAAAAAGQGAQAVVTDVTTVDPEAAGAEALPLPAASTQEDERIGEDTVQSPDPTPAAPAQQDPAMLGAPGVGAAPLAGAPDAVAPDTAAAIPEPHSPSLRVAGEDAPPQTPPGQAPATEPATEPAVVPAVVPAAEPALVPAAEPAEPAADGVPGGANGAAVIVVPNEQLAAAPAAPAVGLAPGADAGAPAGAVTEVAEPQAQAEGTTVAIVPAERVAVAPAPAVTAPAAAPVAEGQPAAIPAAAPAAAPAAGGFAGGDAAAGEKLFRRCIACHKVEEGKHGVGPSLWGVVGRDVAAVEGYNYSSAMQAHEGAWTPAALSDYLENPKAVVPGTKMAFPGLKDMQDRIDVITYMNEHGPSPVPLE